VRGLEVQVPRTSARLASIAISSSKAFPIAASLWRRGRVFLAELWDQRKGRAPLRPRPQSASAIGTVTIRFVAEV